MDWTSFLITLLVIWPFTFVGICICAVLERNERLASWLDRKLFPLR